MYQKILPVVAGCIIVSSLLNGCTPNAMVKPYRAEDADLIRTSYKATDILLSNLRKSLSDDQKILVATFVDLDNLDRTSKFGRIMSEAVASRLSQKGYAVINIKVRNTSIAIRSGKGEFILSRDMAFLTSSHNAEVILAGTYAIAVDKIYVSIKLISVEDSTLLSAVDFSIPRGPRTQELVGQGPLRDRYGNWVAP